MPMPSESDVRVLAVTGNPGSAGLLRDLFARTKWHLSFAGTCSEARLRLANEPPAVVLCEAELSDGCWREVLGYLRSFANPPKLIVTSNLADERLWTEVLTEGAYDLIPRPFERGELFRVVSLAWRDWWHRRDIGQAARA